MDQNGARGQDQHGQVDTYSASEAAEVLNLGKRRVLQMLERGELPATKDDTGRWLVSAPHVHALLRERQHHERRKRKKDDAEQNTTASEEMRELLDSLKDQVSYLREEIHRREEMHREESRRKDHIIAALTQRIPELEAPRDASGGRTAPADEPPKGTPPTRPTPQTGAQRRSWWRRIFGS